MKRISAIILLASAVAFSLPAYAKRENKSIGENGREARRAAKQQRRYVNRTAKQQRKAAKRAQKAQRQAARRRG